jgi:hypothetical protein
METAAILWRSCAVWFISSKQTTEYQRIGLWVLCLREGQGLFYAQRTD